MEKIKIGDRVEVVKRYTKNNGSVAEIGDRGIVEKILRGNMSGYIGVRFEGMRIWQAIRADCVKNIEIESEK